MNNGGLNHKYNNHPLIINHIQQSHNISILMAQEAVGTKGGYKITKKSSLFPIDNMELVAWDKYGITAIYINKNITNHVVIDVPDTIYGCDLSPIDKHIHPR